VLKATGQTKARILGHKRERADTKKKKKKKKIKKTRNTTKKSRADKNQKINHDRKVGEKSGSVTVKHQMFVQVPSTRRRVPTRKNLVQRSIHARGKIG